MIARAVFLHDSDSERCLLPYSVHNYSTLLVAFRQPGCDQWDLLGAGESIDYALDEPAVPGKEVALQVYAVDPCQRWQLEPSPPLCSLERLDRSVQLCHLDLG